MLNSAKLPVLLLCLAPPATMVLCIYPITAGSPDVPKVSELESCCKACGCRVFVGVNPRLDGRTVGYPLSVAL